MKTSKKKKTKKGEKMKIGSKYLKEKKRNRIKNKIKDGTTVISEKKNKEKKKDPSQRDSINVCQRLAHISPLCRLHYMKTVQIVAGWDLKNRHIHLPCVRLTDSNRQPPGMVSLYTSRIFFPFLLYDAKPNIVYSAGVGNSYEIEKQGLKEKK